ncbi:hypothetical protein [Methylobacterium iners]|uniref:Uncharacterized protein n=1 Tax=Methylobacterium iners TaxID=418707 RepID=A0ABQ4S5E3_9HYPH|nr:hypothetical protein [Methylobacterium iners]GJD96900.1 hypothetical protein OCOJLMKI_4127 [Methylobacterium iners]
MLPDNLPLPHAARSLLAEAISALRIAGRIVQKLADPADTYSIDGGPPVTFGGVVALAWDTGLMGGLQGMQ